ncbi:leukocyte antigen CD37 isoform X2 [Harpia harpyja]|uniref:leukocyte antigen CD37 isoform X2 n=1 Tax=Harpia harpyja TaxID=202280 RepID=UPI0022B1A4DB|nr:leukocyte antigen CD37 isoform X2 [Harpia harpyja]
MGGGGRGGGRNELLNLPGAADGGPVPWVPTRRCGGARPRPRCRPTRDAPPWSFRRPERFLPQHGAEDGAAHGRRRRRHEPQKLPRLCKVLPLPLQPLLLWSPLYSLRVWSYIFSGVGIMTMLLGFLGCLGALKEIKAMLLLYFGILLLLFAAQITVAVIVYTQRVTLAAKVATYVQELIRGYPAQGPPRDPHESWDAVQQQLACCGWNGPQDWNRLDGPPRDGDGAIACSCLEALAPNGTHGSPPALPHGLCPMAAPQDIFPMGCAEGVKGWLAENLVTVVGICLGIGLLELCLLMLSMFLVRNLDPDYEKLLRGF